MSDSRYLILTTINHPLNPLLQKTGHTYRELNSPEEREGNLHQFDAIFDFTLFPGWQKLQFLKKLSEKSPSPLFAEGACYWGERLLQEVSSLRGIFSTAFLREEKFFEFHTKSPTDQDLLLTFFAGFPLQGIFVSKPGIGFYFPRILSMLINEAYFALEEQLATAPHIDRAMRFGVNYPQGPIEWSKNIGPEKVAMLLDELWDVTKDPRYRMAPQLRLASEYHWPFLK